MGQERGKKAVPTPMGIIQIAISFSIGGSLLAVTTLTVALDSQQNICGRGFLEYYGKKRAGMGSTPKYTGFVTRES